ncbi:flavin-containing monooxygenase [Nocardiopsis valliformis]|uniref:flavin-containing monooxygenase n=1 Tax=Nocardiopsis valliformis TaxID=239974 RepID=UPI00034B06D3|nr:NAD(P)/FAD-dependent oxidoreductase [Nocardiopsis valliformis]
MTGEYDTEVLVIGAGQAGLSVGHHLGKAGLDFVLFDAAEELGQVWRLRWDSLRLFTSARFASLPGMPFPGDPERYPLKDEVADYFTEYAARFDLPVRLDHRVLSVRPDGDGFEVRARTGTGTVTVRVRQVVIAAGAFQTPVRPAFADELDSSVTSLHSHEYRNPEQLPPGEVLVVGSGNSGVQIAQELSADRRVVVSVGSLGPALPQRFLGRDIFWWLSAVGLMSLRVDSPLGRRLDRPDPLFGADLKALFDGERVRRVGRAVRAEGAEIITEDRERLRPASVLWATGYRNDWSWLDPALLGPEGRPRHTEGIGEHPGLYFLGLYLMRSRGSALTGFVRHDAERIAAAARKAAAPRVPR